MALRWADNFEFWTTMPGTFTSTTNSPTISSGKLSTSGSNSRAQIALTSQGTWIVNMRVNMNTPTTRGLLSFLDGTTVQCSLVIKSTGKLAVYRGTSTQVGSDSTNALIFDTGTTYYDIEIKVVLGDSGSATVKVNGTQEINATSVDITQTANSTADIVGVGDYLNAGATSQLYDHVIIMDSTGSEMNDFIGPVSVNLHKPSGAGNYSQFTPSAGSNYQNVDDTAPDSDSTYNASGTLNQIDTYAMENCPAGVTSVKGVALWWNARRDDSTTRGLSPVWRISSTDYVGTEQNVGSSYAFFTQNYALSPATSAVWTSGEIDGAEAGIKVTT